MFEIFINVLGKGDGSNNFIGGPNILCFNKWMPDLKKSNVWNNYIFKLKL